MVWIKRLFWGLACMVLGLLGIGWMMLIGLLAFAQWHGQSQDKDNIFSLDMVGPSATEPAWREPSDSGWAPSNADEDDLWGKP